MAALAKHIGIPVGSLYTYFESKEALLNTIIEEGWSEFYLYLRGGLSEGGSPGDRSSGRDALSRLAFLVRKALPELFKDLDLIAILLAQADQSSRLSEKLEQLAFLIDSIIMDFRKDLGENAGSGIPNLKTGLAVMLLGSLETMRLIHRAGISIGMEDVIAFLILTIEGALGCSLPAICEPGDSPSTTVARSDSPACADAAGG
jgi:AcrR family transcriptional regulator